MKQLKTIIRVFALILIFGSVAWAQEDTEDRIDVQLGTTVVTATKTEHTLADVPEATVVITKEEIEAQNATNVLEVLRWIPGIRISDAYGSMGGDAYAIDGAPSDYTLMLVDGNRVKGSYILSEIPVSTIERIEIVKGANSLLYGSDALSGVINIITKRAPDRFTADLEASYSTSEENSNAEEVSIGFKLGKLRQLYTYGRKDVEGGEYENDSFAGKFGFDINDNAELKFDFRANQYDKEYTDMDRYDYLLELDWDLDERSSLKAKGFFRDYSSVSHVGGATEGTEEDSTYDEEEIVYTRLLGESHLVTAGYQRMGDGFDYEGPSEEWTKHQDSNSLFLQDEITVIESLVLVPALRVDFHSEWGHEFNPKLSMLWKVTETTSLRASWGTAFRAPTLTEMYRSTFHGHGSWGFWIVGNPDLEPEKSETYRISVEKRFSNDFHGSIALFRNDFKDMIKGGFTDPSRTVYSYSNVAEAMTQGVEVDMKYYFMDSFQATLAYTYLDTEDKETGEELSDTVRHRITGGVRYSNNDIGFTAEVKGEYERNAEADDDTDENNFMLHAGLSKTITKYIKLWVNADNLLDEKQDSGISCEGRKITCGMHFSF
jgi:outer membrane receptor for ferrienterochelin and colicins